MASLRVFVCLLGLIALCDAHCFFQKVEVIGNPPKGCVVDGEKHDYGSEWVTADCMKCSCSGGFMSCCSMILTTYQVPEECELVVDRKACSTRIVLKSDKTKDCFSLQSESETK